MIQTTHPSLQGSPIPGNSRFRVVIYVTEAAVPSVIPYDNLTHINYAFLIPNEDGAFRELLNTWMMGELIRLAHQHNVKVLLSVGGWGWDSQFEKMAASPVTRTAFVQNLVTLRAY